MAENNFLFEFVCYRMRRFRLNIFLCVLIFNGIVYSQQININRIEQMPNVPSPYEMRDWKKTTLGYDSLVFNLNLTGQYLPLIRINNNTINYPDHNSFGLLTVVGTTDPNSWEAINSLAALIGASLTGIDKSNQNGNNFVLMAEEWFNKNNDENVYLNHPDAATGDDWWYETMPNIFFYQLYDLYGNEGNFDNQFNTVADRWLEAEKAMGGSEIPWNIPNMNHRAFDLINKKPNDNGVKEPEASGAIAWILYNAFKKTGDEKYRIGAELCLEFLNNQTSNPSYELQLSYGVYAAAKMNAELGTNYNIEKMINWCFDVGPLRNWGAILGTWGGYNVSGLIGENSSNDYAFAMNVFEQIGALVPLVRYDDRFARAIGKWVLNAANAARLFYPNYLPDNYQDSEEWAHQYDPQSYIAHEALRKEVGSASPYATGDAIDGGWGKTNLTLYGSSHVGILGGIIDTTNIEKMLRLDLLKTDYFHDSEYPTYLYFNPYNQDKLVDIDAGNNKDLYDAVTNTFLQNGVSGKTQINIPSNSAVELVITPSGGTITYEFNKTLVNGIVIDYNSGKTITNYPPRIKSLAAKKYLLQLGDSTNVYCTAVDPDNNQLTYSWTSSSGTVEGNGAMIKWIPPDTEGIYLIKCKVSDGNGGETSDSISIEVEKFINALPKLEKIIANPRKLYLGESSELKCAASDPNNDQLSYSWNSLYGTFSGDGSEVKWIAPNTVGNFNIYCTVSDGKDGIVEDSISVEVRDSLKNQSGNLIAYYPFNGNANDESGGSNNGTVFQAQPVANRYNVPSSAYYFDGINDNIQIANNPSLNFQKSITVSFWMIVKSFYDREEYPLSHGNWENRWKVSITNKKIRWTIKTDTGIKDLDSETELSVDTLYNVSVTFSGSDMEIYLNGKLDAFTNFSGQILQTNIDLMIGQVLPGNSNYNFSGILDDIRIYDFALSREEIQNLYGITTSVKDNENSILPTDNYLYQNYPNPFNGQSAISFNISKQEHVKLFIYDVLGKKVKKLIDENLNVGKHVVVWNSLSDNGEGVSSGIYFYRLELPGFVSSRKMILLR
jgi:Concanavalin A-like lectin/glucanases superfamily/Secretion system C-terminal sorting domain